jgi:hypothetical protein
LVSDIPAGDGKIDKLFLQCIGQQNNFIYYILIILASSWPIHADFFSDWLSCTYRIIIKTIQTQKITEAVYFYCSDSGLCAPEAYRLRFARPLGDTLQTATTMVKEVFSS